MSTQQPTQSPEYQTGANTGSVVAFDAINEPGAYIANWSGHLVRVPEDGVAPGRSPLISFVGQDPLNVTKISDNPWIKVSKARLIASNFDLNVNLLSVSTESHAVVQAGGATMLRPLSLLHCVAAGPR